MCIRASLHGDGGILLAHDGRPLYGLHVVDRLHDGVHAVDGRPEFRPLHADALVGIALILPVGEVEGGDEGNDGQHHVMRYADGEDGVDGQKRVLQILRAGTVRKPFAEPYQLRFGLEELRLGQGRIRVVGVCHLTPCLSP